MALRAKGSEKVAESLALEKAKFVSYNNKEALIIGADQLLDCGGVWLDKPEDKDEAIKQLQLLRGKSHLLATSVCVVKNGNCLWSYTISPQLKMRAFSDNFMHTYLEVAGEEVYGCVGAYQLEGVGMQLFEIIEGDYFAILGLPLLPLLQFLRSRGAIEA